MTKYLGAEINVSASEEWEMTKYAESSSLYFVRIIWRPFFSTRPHDALPRIVLTTPSSHFVDPPSSWACSTIAFHISTSIASLFMPSLLLIILCPKYDSSWFCHQWAWWCNVPYLRRIVQSNCVPVDLLHTVSTFSFTLFLGTSFYHNLKLYYYSMFFYLLNFIYSLSSMYLN